MDDKLYDVVVVGGGNAALCAAMAAQENGACVLILEKAPEEKRGGNSNFTGGGFRVVHHGAADINALVPDLTDEEISKTDFGEYSRDRYLDDLFNVTQYYIDPDLAEYIVDNATDVAQWLRSKGIRFLANYGRQAFLHEGRFKFFGGVVLYANGGGLGLVASEYDYAEKNNIEIRYQTAAKSLIEGPLGIEGVRVVHNRIEEEIRAKSVVLACGGFQANREMRTKYLGPGFDSAKVRGTRYNTGDGINMALDIGAQSYGQWSGCHAVSWERYATDFGELETPHAGYRHSYPYCLMINAEGKRFVDEGFDERNYTYAKYGRIVMQQPGGFAWQIFDSQVKHVMRDEYKTRGATKITANTLEELADKMPDVHSAQMLATIKEYNDACQLNADFDPNGKDGRTTKGLEVEKTNWANTISEPPFEAYSVGCGITFTFGGLKINNSGEVLDTEDTAIPGLYAAGELVGGLFYFNYPGSTGLVAGSVFGRLAGNSAAAHAKN